MRLLAAALLALALAAPALASEAHPTLAEMEGEVMCPICHTTLDQSSSAAAQRIKAFIVRRIRAGDTKSEIKRELVDVHVAGPVLDGGNRAQLERGIRLALRS